MRKIHRKEDKYHKNVDSNITYNIAIGTHLLESTQLKMSCINRKILCKN